MHRAVSLLLLLLALPGPVAAAELLVNSNADAADLDPGDGVCDASPGPDVQCTLRAAVQTANANGETDTITLPPHTYELRIRGENEDFAATGDLDVATPMTIQGQVGERNTTLVEAARLKDRHFDVHAAGALTLANMTLENGRTPPGDADAGFPGAVSGGCVRSAGRSSSASCSSTNAARSATGAASA